MAVGNLSIRIDVDSKDELGMLSDTFNNLSVELQKIEQLRKGLIVNVPHERSFGIATAVRNIKKRLSYILEGKRISLEIKDSDGSIIAMGDEPRTEQVLYNYVNNACNHTFGGGRIRIEIVENVDNVKIEVIGWLESWFVNKHERCA